MRRALVCGAGGFIGGHLVKKLKKEDYWVRGVDIKEHEFAPTEADEFLLLDLREPGNCKKALMVDGGTFDEVYQLAADMGVKIEFIPTKWAGIIPALLTGKFDVIIGGMSVRPDRNLKVNFSIPYDYAGQSMVANKKLAAGFATLKDFDRADVVISARLGSTAADAAKKLLPKAQMRFFDDEAQVIQEVVNGRAHAAVASAPLPAFQAIKYSDKLFMPFLGTFTKEPIGFAVRKGDFDTLNYFNNWIRMTEAKGWLSDRKQYWFETKDWEDSLK